MADEPERQGGASPGKAGSGHLGGLIVLGGAVVILALVIAFLLGRTTAPQSDPPRIEKQGPPAPANQADPPAKNQALGAQAPAAAGGPGAGAANADFLITDRLLAQPRAYEDFQADPVTTSVCIGGRLRIANVASQRVGLVDTPDESDASAQLGFVEPGGVFTLEPQETGTFFISAAGRDGLLFRYSVRRCSARPR
jgi:hypothetical protein